MDRRRLKARVTPWGCLVCLVAVLSTGAAQSFAAASQADTVLSVQGRISLLAADGKHAAVTTTVKRNRPDTRVLPKTTPVSVSSTRPDGSEPATSTHVVSPTPPLEASARL